jgi:hypothetical protein
MEEVRRIKRIHAEVGLSAISVFPAGTLPQVAINHKYMFPLYACAVELDIPILLNVGIPGPRIPMETQKVEHLDEVCWFFPDLKIVMRHGAEPWEDLAVKLMLKWPNLYYSTSAFAPKHYPKAIIDYANTRGADKVIYAGYFPMGLSLERIMATWKTCRSRTRSGPSSCAKMRCACSSSDYPQKPGKHRIAGENTMTEAASDATDAAQRPSRSGRSWKRLKGQDLRPTGAGRLKAAPRWQERNLDIGFPFGWYPVELAANLAVGEVKPLRYFATRPGDVARRGRAGPHHRRLLQASGRAHGPWRQGSRQPAGMPVPRLAL